MIKGLIFDLDGTLLSTDADLCKAINQMRHTYALVPLHRDQIKAYLGDGIRMLVTRSLPDTYLAYLDEAVQRFHDYYALCYNDETLPYEHIVETLTFLQSKGYRLSIVSNKAQIYVEQLVQFHFAMIQFDCVYGDSPTHKRKPDSQGIHEAIQAMGTHSNEVMLIGDSTVDIASALNIPILMCPVAWGFQSYELLFNASKIKPIHSIKDLYSFIQKLDYN